MKDNKITFDDLYKKLKFDDKSMNNIRKAYLFAEKKHKGMKRLSGDDYITHPLHATNILADLNVDDTTIISSLLHETINNGDATYQELENEFGTDVANIVDTISTINKLEVTDENENAAIHLRKVLVGLAEDPRVLYVKLADRLHNMRTNWALPIEKQKFKANETMNVLVPIAHRLGINSIKSELEDLSLKILNPDAYEEILDKLNENIENLDSKLKSMKADISNILNQNGIKHEIKGRVKSVYSIYNKLSTGRKWNDIYDILAIRVFVYKEVDCYTAVGLIHSKYRPVPKRFKDYIANPKENMYQSLHTTVFGSDGEVYEVQIRTFEMDEIAEKGIASHWSYKEKGTKKTQMRMEQKLEMFRNIIESNLDNDTEAFETVINDSILSESIYVFTPKGDVIELPKGATPVDFSYRIHSKVGDTTTGAIVNDQIVPLSYELKNNDIVKIITNKDATPNKDWLSFVKTPQAKQKIKSYFSKQEREELIISGKNILERELRKQKLSFNETFDDNALNKIFKDLKLDNIEDMYILLGSMRYTAKYIIELTKEDKHSVDDILMERINKTSINLSSKDDIIVDGNVNILYSLAKCCHPVKGDDIIGFITKGDGVTVHKKSCINIKSATDRLIQVEWNQSSENTYYTNISLLVNSQNYLTDLISEATKLNINIVEIKNKDIDDGMISNLTVKVKNKDELESLKSKINKFKNVKIMEEE